jgi:hypothetical protein
MIEEESTTPALSSTTLASADLLTTISEAPSLSFNFTVLKSSISKRPSFLTIILESTSEREAVPPTWKVLNVSCVPGSPTD